MRAAYLEVTSGFWARRVEKLFGPFRLFEELIFAIVSPKSRLRQRFGGTLDFVNKIGARVAQLVEQSTDTR